MTTKHTQEPWITNTFSHPSDQIFDVKGVIIADCKWTNHTPDQRELNAARIVSCVNACAGMDDPAVEIERLRTENARLRGALEAAEHVLQVLTPPTGGRLAQNTLKAVTAALDIYGPRKARAALAGKRR